METIRLNSFTKEESKERILHKAKGLKQGLGFMQNPFFAFFFGKAVKSDCFH